jgi:hypothetical protein
MTIWRKSWKRLKSCTDCLMRPRDANEEPTEAQKLPNKATDVSQLGHFQTGFALVLGIFHTTF